MEELAPEVEANRQQAQAAAATAVEKAGIAEDCAATCVDLKEAAGQGALESLQNAEAAKADAEKAALDRAVVEGLAADVDKQIHDLALNEVAAQVMSEAVETATRDAQAAADLASEKAEAASAEAAKAAEASDNASAAADTAATESEAARLSAQAAKSETINANLHATQAQEAKEKAEEAAEAAAKSAESESAIILDMAAKQIVMSDEFTKYRLAQIERDEAFAAMQDRVTEIESEIMGRMAALEELLTGEGPLSPEGYTTLSGARIAPVTIVSEEQELPADAAIELQLGEIKGE